MEYFHNITLKYAHHFKCGPAPSVTWCHPCAIVFHFINLN